VIGGHAADGTTLTSVELYDPTSGEWSVAGQLLEPRSFHTATVLPDGRIFISGGSRDQEAPEIFDPSSGISYFLAPHPPRGRNTPPPYLRTEG
jgi:hypothetical protein